MPIPEWPPRTSETLRNVGLDDLYRWWQMFSAFFNQRMDTAGDVTMVTIGKGLVVLTPDGTKKYRIGVDNAGSLTTTLVT